MVFRRAPFPGPPFVGNCIIRSDSVEVYPVTTRYASAIYGYGYYAPWGSRDYYWPPESAPTWRSYRDDPDHGKNFELWYADDFWENADPWIREYWDEPWQQRHYSADGRYIPFAQANASNIHRFSDWSTFGAEKSASLVTVGPAAGTARSYCHLSTLFFDLIGLPDVPYSHAEFVASLWGPSYGESDRMMLVGWHDRPQIHDDWPVWLGDYTSAGVGGALVPVPILNLRDRYPNRFEGVGGRPWHWNAIPFVDTERFVPGARLGLRFTISGGRPALGEVHYVFSSIWYNDFDRGLRDYQRTGDPSDLEWALGQLPHIRLWYGEPDPPRQRTIVHVAKREVARRRAPSVTMTLTR